MTRPLDFKKGQELVEKLKDKAKEFLPAFCLGDVERVRRLSD